MKLVWEKVINLLLKYRLIVLYIIFGGITTIINIVLYWLCYNFLHWPNVLSTIIAWIGAVIFAFISNKFWVFESKSRDKRVVWEEFVKFIFARVTTGLFDVLLMFVFVDLLNCNGLIMKIIINVFVMVSNYLLSKLIIFKKKSFN